MTQEQSFKSRPRIESLSDLIFGLALSIGALTLIGQPPGTFDEVLAAVGLFGLSFFILISVWRSYSSIMSVLPVETDTLISLNIVLLFVVSIEPYFFNQLFANSGVLFHGVSILYSIDIASMFLILAFFNHSLADEEKHRVPKEYLKRYRFDRNYDLFIAALFLISTLPLFETINVLQITVGNVPHGIPLRVFVWIAALFLGWGRRLLRQTAKTE